MLVEATAVGNYRWIRRVGDIFEIPDALFSPIWMKPVVPEIAPESSHRIEPIKE
jgi:hypothetical protein